MKIRSLIFGALCLTLSACAGHDKFGNELEPRPSAIVYDPVRAFNTSPAQIAPYCAKYYGQRSDDGLGCVVTWDALLSPDTYPCTEVFAEGLSPEHRASEKRFMDSVCNGWRP